MKSHVFNRLLDNQNGPFIKKNFEFKEKVKIQKTGTDLDGTIVTIVGVSTRHLIDMYIIMFDEARSLIIDPEIGYETYQAVTLPESCLERVGIKESYVRPYTLFESKLYIGAMGSGKSNAACSDAFNFILQGGVVICYDSIKGSRDAEQLIKSPYMINVSEDTGEGDFLKYCEKWIEETPETGTFSKINRLIDTTDRPTIFLLEEFHGFYNKEKISELMRTSRKKNIFFYLCTQRSSPSHLKGLDLNNLVPHVFRMNHESDLLGLCTHPLPKEIEFERKGVCFVNSSTVPKKYEKLDPAQREALLNLHRPHLVHELNNFKKD